MVHDCQGQELWCVFQPRYQKTQIKGQRKKKTPLPLRLGSEGQGYGMAVLESHPAGQEIEMDGMFSGPDGKTPPDVREGYLIAGRVMPPIIRIFRWPRERRCLVPM